jgi:hypothetical protein
MEGDSLSTACVFKANRLAAEACKKAARGGYSFSNGYFRVRDWNRGKMIALSCAPEMIPRTKSLAWRLALLGAVLLALLALGTRMAVFVHGGRGHRTVPRHVRRTAPRSAKRFAGPSPAAMAAGGCHSEFSRHVPMEDFAGNSMKTNTRRRQQDAI